MKFYASSNESKTLFRGLSFHIINYYKCIFFVMLLLLMPTINNSSIRGSQENNEIGGKLRSTLTDLQSFGNSKVSVQSNDVDNPEARKSHIDSFKFIDESN